MEKRTEEWFKQSEYDLATAEYMFQGGRYFYAVFMCHLSIEKALKGLYSEKLRKIPPKVHNLVHLLQEIGLKPPEKPGKAIVQLNGASIITRYPEELENIQRAYPKEMVEELLRDAREVTVWIKNQL